jgi:alkanesulfonate monooxygenase SsuD/methylene tetrahydromethanopterin reductase-like flavin-dependent oxidoreductase (luciferase family)
VGERFDFDGLQFRLTDSPALPKPVQSPRPPVLVGGKGKRRTPALAARYADEINIPFEGLEETRTIFDRVRAVCEAEGRDPASLTLSNALVLCCGADEAEVTRRAEAIGRDPDELRANGLAGTPQEVLDTIGRYAEAGAQRVYLQVLDLSDLDHLALVAAEVLPHV